MNSKLMMIVASATLLACAETHIADAPSSDWEQLDCADTEIVVTETYFAQQLEGEWLRTYTSRIQVAYVNAAPEDLLVRTETLNPSECAMLAGTLEYTAYNCTPLLDERPSYRVELGFPEGTTDPNMSRVVCSHTLSVEGVHTHTDGTVETGPRVTLESQPERTLFRYDRVYVRLR